MVIFALGLAGGCFVTQADYDERLAALLDADGDGYVAAAEGGDDCDDADPAIRPGAEELCNGIDDDCNGDVDDGASDATAWYADGDGDGVGDEAASVLACDAPSGHVGTAGDCDDADASAYPEAPESCDGVDNDCDSDIDEGVETSVYYTVDDDGDGYGTDESVVESCAKPDGAVDAGGDCDDGTAAVNPGAPEVCDGVDSDCNEHTEDQERASIGADQAFDSVQSALDAAVDGDEVVVCPGYYQENLSVSASVTLRSLSGSKETTLDGSAEEGATIFVEGLDVLIEGFTIRGGTGGPESTAENQTAGGGVDVWYTDSFAMIDCVVEDNEAHWGGGVALYGVGEAVLTDSTVTSNAALNAGGVYVEGSSVTLSGVAISENTGTVGGGGIAVYLSTAIADSTTEVTSNTAEDCAGVYVIDASWSGGEAGLNVASDVGGGACVVVNDGETRTTSDLHLWGNEADAGAGLYARGAVSMSGLTIESNTAVSNGGGAYLYPDEWEFALSSTTVDNNVAGGTGGGLWGEGTISLVDVDVTGNDAGDDAGGAYLDGTITTSGCAFDTNTASDVGGGMRVAGRVELEDTSVSGNIASGYAGGIYVADECELTGDALVVDGNAGTYGGGLYLRTSAVATLDSASEITRNAADASSGKGGGVRLYGGTLDGGVVSGNSAWVGGGVAVGGDDGGANYVRETEVDGNTAVFGAGVMCEADLTFSATTLSANTASSAGGGVTHQPRWEAG